MGWSPLTAPLPLFRKEDTVSYVNFTAEDMAPKRINIVFQVRFTIGMMAFSHIVSKRY